MSPHLLYLCVEVEQFVFQEVGVEGHKWAGRGGGIDVTVSRVRVRLWKNTGDATPSAWLWPRPLLNRNAIAFVSPSV